MVTSSVTQNIEDDGGEDDGGEDDDDNEDKILENYIRELFEGMDEDSPEEDDDEIVWRLICEYKDKQPLNTNVLEYWYKKRLTHPILSRLAHIVLGVPASQVSVERCFSVLKFILSDHRTRLQHDILQDIMLIRLNHIS